MRKLSYFLLFSLAFLRAMWTMLWMRIKFLLYKWSVFRRIGWTPVALGAKNCHPRTGQHFRFSLLLPLLPLPLFLLHLLLLHRHHHHLLLVLVLLLLLSFRLLLLISSASFLQLLLSNFYYNFSVFYSFFMKMYCIDCKSKQPMIHI